MTPAQRIAAIQAALDTINAQQAIIDAARIKIEAAEVQIIQANVEDTAAPAPTPVPVPPAPPAPTGEFTVTKLASNTNKPSTLTEQFVNLSLPGSGTKASALADGDQYSVTFSGSLADPHPEANNNMLFSITKHSLGNGTGIAINVVDQISLPDGAYFESYHMGYTWQGDGVLNMYTMRRYVALLKWFFDNYPQASKKKVTVSGGSMGAWGSILMAIFYPQLFAATFPSRPKIRYSGSTDQLTIPNFPKGPYNHAAGTQISPAINYKPASTGPSVASIDGGGTAKQRMDVIAYVSNPANKMPWIGLCGGRKDGYMVFQDFIDFCKTMQAVGRPFAAEWNNGDHSAGDTIKNITSTYGYDGFELGRGVPLLTNCSLDKDPAVDLVGSINLGFQTRNTIESANSWTCEIRNKTSCTVTVRPYSEIFTATVTPKVLTLVGNASGGEWKTVNFDKAAAPAPSPVPVPPPAPTPVPVPPPAPAPAGVSLNRFVLNPSKQLLFWDYQKDAQAYDRTDELTEWSKPTETVQFRAANAGKSGDDRVLEGSLYQLAVDQTLVASLTLTGAKRGTFSFPTADIAEGWHWLNVVNSSGETCAPWVAYMKKGAVPVPQDYMPVVMGSHTVANTMKGAAIYTAMVPSVYKPLTKSVPPRETPPFTELLRRSSLIQTFVTMWRPDDGYRPRLTDGILNTFNQEPYYWSSGVGPKYPSLPCLDGPFGMNAISMATHIQTGRNGKYYFTDFWRFGKIENGVVTTLAGYRHNHPAPRELVQDEPTRKKSAVLIGDWSRVPEERRGFHELWGNAWDLRTLETGGPPIDNGSGVPESPHTGIGPVNFLSDSQGDRICKLQHSPTSHDVPVIVTEFITGLNDPWDVVCDNGILYVSVRKDHRIAAFSADTGAFIKDIIKGNGNNLASIDQNRFVKRTAPIEVIRAEPCVLPEGLYLQDGWLYFGSMAMGQVRRVNLLTNELQVIVKDFRYGYSGTNFCKIAVSDGTFGPRGTVFLVTWGIDNQGRPRAFLPDGTEWGWNSADFGGDARGLPWETLGYGSAVGVGNGVLVCGCSAEGIIAHSKALPTDLPAIKAADWANIRYAYDSRGYQLLYGHGGWGFYGLDLPWGVDAMVDKYLIYHGHEKP